MAEALTGIKVLDFTWALAGMIMGKNFADFGATVIRVENATRPATNRTSTPFKDNIPGINRSGYDTYFNGNKYSISIDLNNRKGIDVAKRLISWADIVIENFRPGVMGKWGLDYEHIKEINPGVIMLSSSSQGQTGPFGRVPGLGNHLNALTGLVHFTGWPDRDPVTMMLAYSDYIVPNLSAAAILAALEYRRRTGKGQYLDFSQFEAMMLFFGPAILDYTVNGTESGRQGNQCAYAAPHGAYRCQGDDRWCAIAVFDDDQWAALRDVMGNPSWANDPGFSTLLGRKRNEEELNSLIESWTLNFEAENLMSKLQSAGVPSGVVKNAKDIFEDPQLAHRNFWFELTHREIGPFHHLGQPAILSETPAKGKRPAPCLGEHTEQVCTNILGMSDNEFRELFSDGAFGEW